MARDSSKAPAAATAAIALTPIEPGADSVVRVAEQRFAADIALVVKLLQSHLAANTNYTETLTRANADLPQLRSSEEIRAVVLTLIDENRKVQVKIDELSKTLDESVNKFEKLSEQSRRRQRQGDARRADRARQPALLRS